MGRSEEIAQFSETETLIDKKTQNLILTEFADDWFELEIEMLKPFELDKTWTARP